MDFGSNYVDPEGIGTIRRLGSFRARCMARDFVLLPTVNIVTLLAGPLGRFMLGGRAVGVDETDIAEYGEVGRVPVSATKLE